MDDLMRQAKKVYDTHFPAITCFERAIFFSWGCTIGDCTFCYMSTQPDDKKPTETKRSNASILAECIIAKKLGWEIGFFTGGVGVLKPSELLFLLESITKIIEDKLWLSVGPVSKPLLEKCLPYIKGVVGSTETINPVLHKQVCPSKPLAPYERMFEVAHEMGLKKAMTFIVGMGEVRSDIELLTDFIRKYQIDKIHVYGLIPQKDTEFEGKERPTKEDQGWWISTLRVEFPELDIQCGIWEDRVEYVSYLLNAGANSISKFKALKLFGSPIAQGIEKQATLAGRDFKGSLTVLPDVNWDAEVDRYGFDAELAEQIKDKMRKYIKGMYKSIRKAAQNSGVNVELKIGDGKGNSILRDGSGTNCDDSTEEHVGTLL